MQPDEIDTCATIEVTAQDPSFVEVIGDVLEIRIEADSGQFFIDGEIEEVIGIEAPGPPGPPGPAGDGGTFSATAGETIFGHRAVRIVDDEIFHPSLAVVAHAPQVVGIALQSGNIGALLTVRTSGLVEEPSWNWLPGFVYCGDSGVLTQTAPTSGWALCIGRVKNPTTIEVDVDVLVMRS